MCTSGDSQKAAASHYMFFCSCHWSTEIKCCLYVFYSHETFSATLAFTSSHLF